MIPFFLLVSEMNLIGDFDSQKCQTCADSVRKKKYRKENLSLGLILKPTNIKGYLTKSKWKRKPRIHSSLW